MSIDVKEPTRESLKEILNKIKLDTHWIDRFRTVTNECVTLAKKEAELDEYKPYISNLLLGGLDIINVASGCFSKESVNNIKNVWGDLKPLIKNLAENQNGAPDYETYTKIWDILSKIEERNLPLAIRRFIIAFQPKKLCSVVKDDCLKDLYDYLRENTSEEVPEYQKSWFVDSYNMMGLFKKSLGTEEDVATLPWQVYEYFKNLKSRDSKTDDTMVKEKCEFLKSNYNMILSGAPGTGKTYLARQVAALMIGCDLDDLKDRDQFDMVQFHPSYDYTDFVEGLRPNAKGDGFVYTEGIFKRFCKKAANDNSNRPYVFVIDEINRGEVSKIFGELFFSIDPEYRGDKSPVHTQYQNMISDGDTFAKGFYVPKNVYLIGTMNDIDRSTENIDFAFRRRFPTVEIKVEDTLDSICASLTDLPDKVREEAKSRLKSLNAKISADSYLGPAYCIGGSYLLKLNNFRSGDIYEGLWNYYLENVIREYLKGLTSKEKEEKVKNFRDSFLHQKASE
jgi:hypothetical protein